MSAHRLTSVAIACAVAALVLGVVVMASLALGSRQIAPNIVWESLVHGGTSQDARVVLSLRVSPDHRGAHHRGRARVGRINHASDDAQSAR
mgnify:CR=1 FL=1